MFDDRRYLIPFRATLLPQIFTDVLVIGGGVAGMRAAIAAAPGTGGTGADVIVAMKEGVSQSNTYWAQGGIACVLDAAGGDTFESHVEDTLVAGAGLCDEPVVRAVVEGGPERLAELRAWGMRFDRDPAGEGSGVGVTSPTEGGALGFDPPAASRHPPAASQRAAWEGGEELPALGREGGHTYSRIVHTDGDATGRALSDTLRERLRTFEPDKRVRVFEECFVLDLITEGNGSGGRCLGAITHHPKHGLQVIWAGAVILASGGSGQVYRESTNPRVATGDGLAMAYRAGAELADMAFMQFHPTTLYVAGSARSLITEAVRGEGAHLLDKTGYRFMPDYDDRGELAPRDIVSRSILQQMDRTHYTHVYLDVRHLGREAFAARFPGIMQLLEKFEIDPGTQPIPVHPSAHYMVGGVRCDADGRTSVPGLFAVGEAGCSGLHGANRLASNSLLEGLVLGERAGRAAAAEVAGGGGGAAAKPGHQRHPPQRAGRARPGGRAVEPAVGDVAGGRDRARWGPAS